MTSHCVEDTAALTMLGAEARQPSYCNAVYRTDRHGKKMHPNLVTLLEEVHSAGRMTPYGPEERVGPHA